METNELQTRKNENIIKTNVPEEMYQKYLVENLFRKWKEKFLDEDTGEVIEVERKEIILERGTFIGDDQMAVIQFHTQTGDIDGGLITVSDQKRLAVLSNGWHIVPWCVTARINDKPRNFLLLARNIFQALDIVTDYVELHYDSSFYITTAKGFKDHIFLQDLTSRLVEEDGTEKPEEETADGQKDVYFFYSVEAEVKFGGKLTEDSSERSYRFLVYAKDLDDVKSRIEKYITDTIRENKGYGDLGYFEQALLENDFEVTLKTGGTVNCTAVISREFTMAYNPTPEDGKKEEGADEAPAPEASPEE